MLPSLNPRNKSRGKTRFGDDSDDAIDSIPLEELGSSKPSSPFLNPSVPRSLSASPFSEHGRLSPCQPRALSPGPYTHPPRTQWAAIAQSLRRFWDDNRAVLLVGISQFFGALMNLAAKLLELESGMRPMQILFARQSMTTALSCLYMWWNMVPDFPLGPRGVRGVLVIRGVSGFFGIYGMWFSMQYLPLAEATVITFLAPMLSGYLCDILLNDPFTRREQLASVVAITGVVLIARPTSLFGSGYSDDPTILPPNQTNSTIIPEIPTVFTRVVGAGHETEPTPTQRLLAIIVALVGVLGAAGAYTAIRCIGKRAHPLITVTYFSACSTLVSTVALFFSPLLGWPDMNFAGLLLSSAYEWFLLLSLGTCGFVMQFIMTSGLGGSDGRNANRATAMTYTHMLFAAGFDRWVFGHRMGVVSVVGCGLIVGSALWAALGKKTPPVSPGEGRRRRERRGDVERDGMGGGEEAMPMLYSGGGNEEEEEEAGEGRRPPRNHP